MNYDEALWYLEQMHTVLAGNTQYTNAINKAKDALRDCLEIGLTGDDEESIRWDKVSTTHVVLDPQTGETETTEVHHEQAH